MKLYTFVLVALSAALVVTITAAPASAAPKPAPVSDEWLLKKGVQQEGPLVPRCT